jgi:DNA-binding Xre family transcriptional regulator
MLKVLSSQKTMIRWCLSEVMARYDITGVQLAKKMGITDTAVSRMKKRKSMPALGSDRLAKLCDALNDLIRESDQKVTVTPADLIFYSYDKDKKSA